MEFEKAQVEDQEELKELETRHTQQLQENRMQLEETLPTVLKQSTELLNLRKIQQNLAKQKNY